MTASTSSVIHLVTDRRQVSPEARTAAAELAGLERWFDAVVEAGVDVIQVRERDLDAAVLSGLVRRLLLRTQGARCQVMVNDRADVALACGAEGAHLRADGPSVAEVRALGPEGWVVGRSVHQPAEVARHQAADYLLFGTVFGSRSKAPASPVAGLAALGTTAAKSTVPVVAIGGVTPATAARCIAAGASGVAGIGVFLPEGSRDDAMGPVRAVAALREAMRGC